jgi:hypothetical protein
LHAKKNNNCKNSPSKRGKKNYSPMTLDVSTVMDEALNQ